jgi:uncharacterized membrane-anchored protein
MLRYSAPVRVPEVTVAFWVAKGLSTALGESTSDYLVHAFNPYLAVGAGFVVFLVAMVLQLSHGRYSPIRYWFAVAMVGIFGTMVADVAHVALGVPYLVSSVIFALALVGGFVAWAKVEGTLSIHDVTTLRRELFYWFTVIATFAMGTAIGDLTAITFRLGYLGSLVLFSVVIVLPGAAYRWIGLSGIPAFWSSYVLTRPLGASFADWTGKPIAVGGLGWGDGTMALVLALALVLVVGIMARTSGSQSPYPRRGAW